MRAKGGAKMPDGNKPKCPDRVRYCVEKGSIVTLTIKVIGPSVQYNIIGRFSGKPIPVGWETKNTSWSETLNPAGCDLTGKGMTVTITLANTSPNPAKVDLRFEPTGGAYYTPDESPDCTIDVPGNQTIEYYLDIKFVPGPPKS